MEPTDQRACPVCQCNDRARLHRQTFVRPGLPSPVHYDVVACRRCGCVYATDLPDGTGSADYYADASHHLHGDGPPAGLTEIHEQFVDHILRHAPEPQQEAAILDLGAGGGHFLHRLQRRGFTDLTGLDASRDANLLAARRYGLPVHAVDAEDFAPTRAYRLICLCGVLEHLVEPRRILEAAARWLAPDGLLFVAVPDAARFSDGQRLEPFQEFALEHVNFFAQGSLDNLLSRCGFAPVSRDSAYNPFYDSFTLMGLYRKAELTPSVRADDSAKASVAAYVARSRRRLAAVNDLLDAHADADAPLVVWGVGELTMRLLATTRLGQANIAGFVDSHPRFHGRTLQGAPIHGPGWLTGRKDAAVWIMSYVHGNEIRTQASRLGIPSHRLITLPTE
ncbi:MAG TPA: class I SAM-dependent methyltransferase [Rhodocyclaceae bacterium]|nr:class I SAM-dependent methyltransferase [Rhodocyclaceae bacterium]